MRVSSPIGELPFEPTRLRLREGRIEMDGQMGAWPAHVVVGPDDIPALIRLVRRPLLATLTLAVVIGLAVRVRSRR
jgi:hypothetical protein